MRRLDPSENERFVDGLAGVNMRRAVWLAVAATLVCFYGLAMGLLCLQPSGLEWAQGGSCALAVLLLTGLAVASRRPPGGWQRGLVAVVMALVCAATDWYYFQALTSVGPTSVYVVGMVLLGVVFVQPPVWSLSLLAGNHVVFCLLLLFLESRRDERFLISTMMDGSVGVLLAVGASLLLYASKRREFHKERWIAMLRRELRAANARMVVLQAIPRARDEELPA